MPATHGVLCFCLIVCFACWSRSDAIVSEGVDVLLKKFGTGVVGSQREKLGFRSMIARKLLLALVCRS